MTNSVGVRLGLGGSASWSSKSWALIFDRRWLRMDVLASTGVRFLEFGFVSSSLLMFGGVIAKFMSDEGEAG